MNIAKAEKIIENLLAILPPGNYKTLSPLNSDQFLPADKNMVRSAIRFAALYYKKNKILTKEKRESLTKAYISIASFISRRDYRLVEKINLSHGKLYTEDEEEVEAWFSSPKNRREYDRSNQITGLVMLKAKKLKREIELLFRS